MPIFDVVLLVFLGAFLLYGFYIGLVKMTLNLISTILAIIIAINIYLYLYDFIPFIGFGSEAMGKIIAFILVLSIINYFLSFIFKIIAKILRIVTSLPIISFANRVLGSVLGLIQGVLVLGIIIYLMSRYALTSDFLNSAVSGSDFSPLLLQGVNWMSPLVPEALQSIESVIII
jgi:uncharacterized membrane protein required for colicin V production